MARKICAARFKKFIKIKLVQPQFQSQLLKIASIFHFSTIVYVKIVNAVRMGRSAKATVFLLIVAHKV